MYSISVLDEASVWLLKLGIHRSCSTWDPPVSSTHYQQLTLTELSDRTLIPDCQ